MELKELLWGSEGPDFIWELILRTSVMFSIMMLVLQIAGKRGIKQMSIFEMIMIIALGSAAGDPMLYKDAGLLSAFIVFAVVIIIYRLIVLLITKSEKAELFLEGKPEYIIQNGVGTDNNLNNAKLGIDEFFSELRNMNVEHLGQVKSVIMETNGLISVLYYKDNEVKYGLPIWPEKFYNRLQIPPAGKHCSCIKCGYTMLPESEEETACPRCSNTFWIPALNTLRIS